MRGNKATFLLVASCLSSVMAFTPTSVRASQPSAEVVGRLIQLASNDGTYEASGSPAWFVAQGESLIPISADEVAGESGAVVRFSQSPGDEVSESELSRARMLSSGVTKAAVVPNRILTVVPITFEGSSWTAENQSVANQVATTTKTWWRSMSANQETLNIRFTPTLNLQSVVTGCDVTKILTEVMAYADSLGLKKTSQHVMATFTGRSISCWWGGLGEVGGWSSEPSFTWTFTNNADASKIWIHELGHNLGLPHSNSCLSGYTFTYLRSCVDGEYGNTLSVMGMGNTALPFTPADLRKVGWLPDQNVATWDNTARTFILQRSDRTDSGITAINIPPLSVSNSDVSFWLQYSTASQSYYNGNSTTVVSSGVVLTFVPSDSYRQKLVTRDGVAGSLRSLSYLCDLTPSKDTPYSVDYQTDPRLLVGQTWVEPRGRYSVRVDAADADKATVTIIPVVSTVVAPVSVAGVADPNGLAAMSFAWSSAGLVPGAGEPVEWVVDLMEDTSRTCRGSTLVTSCTISGLTRGTTYTPRMVHVTGLQVSPSVVGAPVVIQSVAPLVSATSTATSDSLTFTVSIDNGGSALTTPTVLTIEGQPQCELSDPAGGVCVFQGLARYRVYSVISTSANGVGARTTTFSGKTLGEKPDAPVLSAAFENSDLHLTIAASERDLTNVVGFFGRCRINNVKYLEIDVDLDEGENSKKFTIPNARKKSVECQVASYAPGSPREGLSDEVRIHILKSGRIQLPRITAKIVATSPRPGVVTLKWRVVDKNGKVSSLVVKTSKKSCSYRGRTTCTIKRLVSGSTFVAIVKAYGPSGAISYRTTVVVQ